ncbi:PH domain-containing protein [Salinilacihabitans rarus]|uniref:PH domain-containing protein n=1 Tax=Salinilacihabitans rarus TaxID=2961596 RepID=UPI0020C8B468|nr:PH domain-containing protein [Salinilacihabitans rarus]
MRDDGRIDPRDPTTGRDLGWLALEADEEIRWRGGPRIQTVYPWVAVALLGTVAVLGAVAAGGLPSWGVIWLPVLWLPAGWRYARVSRTTFLITDRRIAVKTGVLGLSVRVLGIDRIQNTTFEQDATGRLFDYGTVEIDPAGGAALTFWNVDDPARVRARLDAQRDRGSSATVPGSRDQWLAVLEHVRGWRRALERGR